MSHTPLNDAHAAILLCGCMLVPPRRTRLVSSQPAALLHRPEVVEGGQQSAATWHESLACASAEKLPANTLSPAFGLFWSAILAETCS